VHLRNKKDQVAAVVSEWIQEKKRSREMMRPGMGNCRRKPGSTRLRLSRSNEKERHTVHLVGLMSCFLMLCFATRKVQST